MQTRFKKNAKIFDIVITAVAAMVSVGVMLYAIGHFGLQESWPELVLNLFYIACLAMIWMYFFNRLDHCRTFNYDIYMEPNNEYTEYLLTEIWTCVDGHCHLLRADQVRGPGPLVTGILGLTYRTLASDDGDAL